MPSYNEPLLKELENGAVLCSMANRLLNTSTIGFVVGSRNDPPWFSGAAHLVEHDIFRRSRDLTGRQIDRMMRRYLGGSNGCGMNVCTLNSYTSFGHQDLLRRQYLQTLFSANARIVRDGMYDLRRTRSNGSAIIIDQAVHEVERAAVANETGENDDFLPMLAHKAALGLLYRSNPARFLGFSDTEQLGKVKLGRIKQWAMGWYVPRNMRIILLGPTQQEALQMVKDAQLDQIPDWESVAWGYDHSDDVPTLEGIRELTLERSQANMTHTQIFWPTETSATKDGYTLEVLACILKDRIENELRCNNRNYNGGIYHPAVEWERTSSSGFLDVCFATRGGARHSQELVERTLKVCENIKTDVSAEMDEDVEDARENLAESFLEDFRYVPGRLSDRLLFALSNGDDDLERFKKYRRRILRVTSKQVRAVAAKYLQIDKFVKVVVRPAE